MGNHVREVTTEEKIKHAEQRINELNLLINHWRVQGEKERKTIEISTSDENPWNYSIFKFRKIDEDLSKFANLQHPWKLNDIALEGMR